MKTFARTLIFLIVLYVVFFPLNLFYNRARNTIFPQQYRKIVLENSRSYRLDPLFLAALIYVESSFRSGAVSKSGAIGLMQLMPATAQQAARQLGIDPFRQESLFDPSINLKLGCYHLSELADEFKNLDHILIAYNAGRGNLLKWSQQGQKPLINAYTETQKYVVRIRRIYQMLTLIHKIRPFEYE